MGLRIFHAAGSGNIIEAHKSWVKGVDHPDIMSLTFSGQFEDYCRNTDSEAYLISYHPDAGILHDGRFTLEHRPKRTSRFRGLRYHFEQIAYGLGLLLTARRFRAQIAVLNAGMTHNFVGAVFRAFGIKVVNVQHNTLWPTGFPPQKIGPRLILWLDALYFRWLSQATIGVSRSALGKFEK